MVVSRPWSCSGTNQVQEIERYLKHIKKTWDRITLRNRHIRAFVDIQTVEALQRRVPGVSKVDQDFAVQAMETGLLFPKLVNKELRKHLKASLLSVRCLIPSIKSMHENLKYLKVGSDLLKRLLVGDQVSKGTLHCTLRAGWEERWKNKKKIPRDVLVEKTSGAQVIKDVSVDTCRDLTYKQLWIFVLRNFADLGGGRR